jgi:hypothetical protein
LILGDTAPAEFQPVLDLVQRHVSAGSRRAATDFKTSRQMIGDGWFPDIVIALQAWPDQFSVKEVEELISLCPLARILCCFGPWCDSDGRTKSTWPLGVRVPAAAFASRFEHEVALLADSHDAGPPLPLTASRTEIFEFDFARPASRLSSNQGFSVVSPDRRFREMLMSAIEAAGSGLHESDNTDQTATILFDADPWDNDRATALATSRAAHPRSRLVACVGFPRPHIEDELHRQGADSVWFKLAPLTDLIDLLAAPLTHAALT